MDSAAVSAPPGRTAGPPEGWRERVPRVLIKLLAVYSAIAVSLVGVVVLVGSHDPVARAIITMGIGLVLLWCVLGGVLMLRYRDHLRSWLLRQPIRWEWRFFLLATLLALLEEAITTSMTNLVPPWFGVAAAQAHITASANYLVVIGFSSVVLFVPEFAAWVLLLRRFDFSANEVLLLYGLLGTTMEATLNPSALFAGFWFFVYGLMVYLPAYTRPRAVGAPSPPWWSYPVAYVLPLVCALPVAGVDSLLGHALGVHLWH